MLKQLIGCWSFRWIIHKSHLILLSKNGITYMKSIASVLAPLIIFYKGT